MSQTTLLDLLTDVAEVEPSAKSQAEPDNHHTPSFFADEEPISVYTRAEAINDGLLVDLTALCPEICRQNVGNIHVACTASVWAIIDKAINNKKHLNDLNGVVHDILWMAQRAIARLKKLEVGCYDYFSVIITGAARKRTFQFKIGSTIDENGHPCLTILQIEED